MARVDTNGVFNWVRGSVGDVVVKKYQYGEVMSRKPRMKHVIPSEKQLAHQARWALAAEYYRRVQADPALMACYAGVMRKRGTPLPTITNRDFFGPPKVFSIELRRYEGKAGDRIVIEAWDDTCVKAVEVTMRDAAGNLIEAGLAASEGGLKWEYRAKAAAPSNGSVTIEATAIDLPGNRATRTETWHRSCPMVPAPVPTSPAAPMVAEPHVRPSAPPIWDAQAEGGL